MAKSNRDGQRKRRDSFPKRVPDLGYYIILTDADETEKNYLNGIQRSLPKELQGRLVIRVLKSKTDKMVAACKEQLSYEPQYGIPWIVFDRDKVVPFDAIIAQAEREGINVGWSNPCIEIWFDAYFGKMHGYMDSVTCCREFGKTYERRTGQEYEKAEERIYETLNRFGNEDVAIRIASDRMRQHQRDGKDKPSEMCPGTTLYGLIHEVKLKSFGRLEK